MEPEQPMSQPKEILTVEMVLTSSGRYPARATHAECTQEVRDSAKELCRRVNLLLNDLGIDKVDVTSGFRTTTSNAQVANAAKKSLHMRAMACDLLDDKEQNLAAKVKAKPELLKKYDLWLENPDFTKGKNTNWVHLDMGSRSDRPSRMFNP